VTWTKDISIAWHCCLQVVGETSAIPGSKVLNINLMLEACALGVVDFHAGLRSKQEQTAGGFYSPFRVTVTSNKGSRRIIQKVDQIIRFTIKLLPQKLQYRTCGNTTERAD